ncbi:MAG TPA: YbjN domain-containing protein [Candidatus Nitrosotenuis sp.]|jgi:hypothetical protein|nr:YbjN domain-containing protein [Candidatus Nitrosotenuis sp.]
MLGKLFRGTTSLEKSRSLVEAIFRQIKLDPDRNKVPTQDGSHVWALNYGEQTLFLCLYEHEGTGYFKVFSPVVYLPDDNLLPFYRKLLEVNWDLTSAWMAARGDEVMVIGERALEGMDVKEGLDIVTRVGFYSEAMRKMLTEEFSAPPHEPSPG